MAQGQPKQAAKLYQNLAQNQPAWQHQFHLLATEAHLRSGDSDSAKQFADRIDASQLSEAQRQQLKLVYAQIDLGYGNAEQALTKLQTIQFQALNPEQQQSYHRSQAFANALTGNLLGSAIARIRLNSLLTSPQLIRENNAAILEALRLLPERDLQVAPRSGPDALPGWLRLASLLKRHKHNQSEFDAALAQWRLTFPNHPARIDLLHDYLQSQPVIEQPNAIAVLLPESGPYAAAANAIREGITAAYHNDNSVTQPALRFYDASQSSPAAAYAQAVAEGAELVIGPLIKENIDELSAGNDLPVPVLALNHIEGLSKRNLFQFALSPIDEAEQLAIKASSDGHYQALMLTPATDQGERTARYLSEAWLQHGGEILESQRYDPNQHDFSAPIKDLLNLDESERRYQALRRLLGANLKYTPRRRHDVDAIFINAHPTAARSLNPQLRFYHAAKVPVYATPNLYGGQPNPARDIDLNNITFCDIPRLFPDYYQDQLSPTTPQTNLQPLSNNYPRLTAMGIDAYRLIAHLNTLSTEPYAGSTGKLSLNAENRITRQLICAKFSDGIPVATGYAGQPSEQIRSSVISAPVTEEDEFEFSDVQ